MKTRGSELGRRDFLLAAAGAAAGLAVGSSSHALTLSGPGTLRAGEGVVNTPTRDGLRRGVCYENICDIVVTGDSFGMHLAIALKKYVIAWFGLSCWTEIDLFDRGVKLFNADLACSPCWRKDCPFNLECIQMVDLDRIVAEVLSFRDRVPAPPSSVTS